MSNVTTNTTIDPSLLAAMNSNRGTKSATQEAQDKFMTLLVTQMKNQDPLNPLDNAQITSQLAQLSTVTGIDKLNETMTAMNGSFKNSQNLQAASMIGHGVVVPGSNVELKDGKSVLGFDLPQNADKIQVKIRDENGSLIKTLNFNSMTSGFNSISWDGKNESGTAVANGNYNFEVSASAADTKLTVTPMSFGLVSSVSFGSQGTMLSISNAGDVLMSDVKQIF
ncbi:flagellar hook assembly protein FlgD [Undibacterium flavidum]|uniref:Basal-body rod modification protein FlgD n=1 Tax=Undibacterium flavidum TaxID=2762297 RepID=A0ABR6YEK4_9BURK|nr:flagellar hook assembly protein FlgD [Undibacterium flavidum]MBC3875000.1 flagellar hook assembly protein FlgD [Undibacterium flavidum]